MEEPRIGQDYISRINAGIVGDQVTTGTTTDDGTTVTGTTNTGRTVATVAGTVQGTLPKEVSVWSRIKAFLLQDVSRDVVITMTPYQAKVLKEVHDFWFQEVNFGKVKDFLFQEITFGKKSK